MTIYGGPEFIYGRLELLSSVLAFIYGAWKGCLTFQKTSEGVLKPYGLIHKLFYSILKAFEFILKTFDITLLSVYTILKPIHFVRKTLFRTHKASELIHKPFCSVHKPSAQLLENYFTGKILRK